MPRSPRTIVNWCKRKRGALRLETAKALQDFVKAKIAPYKYPRAVAFVDELPKTKTGKIQRFRLREAEEGSGS